MSGTEQLYGREVQRTLPRTIINTGLRLFGSEGTVGAQREAFLESMEETEAVIVQIGANDGTFDDPLNRFFKTHSDVRALLVEPQEQPFMKLRELHKDNANISCVQKAVAKDSDTLELWSVIMDQGIDPLGKALARINPDSLSSVMWKRPIKRLGGYSLASEIVPAAPLVEVLKEGGVEPEEITVFVSDTEGCDVDIVDQLLDSGARPDLVQYEHLLAASEDVENTNKRLVDSGYSLAWSFRDVLAVQKT